MAKIQAETVAGIYAVEDFDKNFDSLTREKILESVLSDLKDGVMVYAEVSDEMYKKLDEKYGIK